LKEEQFVSRSISDHKWQEHKSDTQNNRHPDAVYEIGEKTKADTGKKSNQVCLFLTIEDIPHTNRSEYQSGEYECCIHLCCPLITKNSDFKIPFFDMATFLGAMIAHTHPKKYPQQNSTGDCTNEPKYSISHAWNPSFPVLAFIIRSLIKRLITHSFILQQKNSGA
jgi:hypothetical protein